MNIEKLLQLLAIVIIPGCIAPNQQTRFNPTTGELDTSSVWTEISGDYSYDYSESRPDGTYKTVKVNVNRAAKIDQAAQARIAETQALLQAGAAIASEALKKVP